MAMFLPPRSQGRYSVVEVSVCCAPRGMKMAWAYRRRCSPLGIHDGWAVTETREMRVDGFTEESSKEAELA